MLEEDDLSTEEVEERTIRLLRDHSYHLNYNRIWREGYLGAVGVDGIVKIRYSLNMDTLNHKLELRNFLKANSICYQEEGLSEVKEDLTKKLDHLTEILKKLNDTS